MKSTSKLVIVTLLILGASTVFAQTTGGTPKCSAGQIRSYAIAKGQFAAADANVRIAEEALQLVKEHQARLDASYESIKADVLAAASSAPDGSSDILLNLANKWSEKALKTRNRAKEKALKAAEKTLSAARAKETKAQAKLTAATPSGCSLQ